MNERHPNDALGHDAGAPPEEMPPAPREPAFNLPSVVVAFIAACVLVHLVRAFVLTPDQDWWVIVRFAFIPVRYSGQYVLDAYAYISPLSYSLLHGGFAHLIVNVVWLAAFGSPLAARIGPMRFCAFWVATSLGAVGLHYVLHSLDPTPLVGASGAISGMMGAAARFGFQVDRRRGRGAFEVAMLSIPAVFTSRMAVTFLAVWMGINLLMGFGFGTPDGQTQIAWEAHIGGFLVGFLLLRAFDRPAPPVQG